MRNVTSRVRKFLAGSPLTFALVTPSALQAEDFDPTAEENLVTAEELDSEHADYEEGAVDIKGAPSSSTCRFTARRDSPRNKSQPRKGSKVAMRSRERIPKSL